MTPQEQMVKARTGLILDAPFFGSMAMRLELKADPTCETAWTNGKVLGFNPAYIETLPLRETTGLVAHEIVHLLSLHHTRRQNRDQRVWNEACDRAINTIVLESGFRLPKGHLRGHPGSAEEIYSGMQDKQQEQGQESDPGKSGEIRDLPGNNGGPPGYGNRQGKREDAREYGAFRQ